MKDKLLRIAKIILKCFLGLALTIVLIVGGLYITLSTDWGQQKLYEYTFDALQKTLDTRLVVKEVEADIIRGRIMLHGVEIDDRDGVTMLQVDSVGTQLGLGGIFNREIYVNKLFLKGARMVLYKKTPTSEPNYQFVLDAFKKKSLQKKKTSKKPKKEPFFHIAGNMTTLYIGRTCLKWDILSAPRKGKDTIDVNHLDIQDFGVKITGKMADKDVTNLALKDLAVIEKKSGMIFSLNRVEFRTLRQKSLDLIISGLKFKYQDKQLSMKTLHVEQRKASLDFTKPLSLKIDSITFKNDNHKPRKNTGKPNRGWFDQGHLDMVASMQATVNYISKDSLYAQINHLELLDKPSDLDIRHFSSFINRSGKRITATNIFIAMMHTRVRINKVDIDIPRVQVHDFPLEADVYLQDLAKPFATPLSNFTTPLKLRLVCGGDIDRYLFKNIHITTLDNRLVITGEGDLCDVTKKRDLTLHFWDLKMSAVKGVKEQIVNHFAKKVNLKMTKQLKALGDISYTGKVGIAFRREDIAGTLFTKYGNLNFDFTLDGNTRHMTGTMSTDSMDLGSIMNIKKLSIARTRATYDFDITSKRKAEALGIKRKGRLPIGSLKANVGFGSYGSFKVKNLAADMVSDGREAKGHIDLPGNLIDIDVDFSYIQTDYEQGLRIHPKMKFTDKVKKFFGLHKDKKNKQDKQTNQDKQDKQNENGDNDSNKKKKKWFK
ncbi:MAG: hypothetical protein IKO58_05255 [Prevotella sp.]|nr:hypothetical protein [Prevotella sp.]